MSRAASSSSTAPLSEVLDVTEEHAALIRRVCSEALEGQVTTAAVCGDLARRIRAEVERGTGLGGWSVVVGRAFGAGVTHRHQQYAFVAPGGGLSVLLWRA